MPRERRERGQAMIETAIAIILFLTLSMGVVDFGRGVYLYNGLSNLAREASHYALLQYTSSSSSPCYWSSYSSSGCLTSVKNYTLGLGMAPGLSAGNVSVGVSANCGTNPCAPSSSLTVTMSTPFQPVVGGLLGIGTFNITANSTTQYVQSQTTPTPSTATATPNPGPTFTPVPTPILTGVEDAPSNFIVSPNCSGGATSCEFWNLTWTMSPNTATISHFDVEFSQTGTYTTLLPVSGSALSTTADTGSAISYACFKVIAVYPDGQEYYVTQKYRYSGAPNATC